MKTLTSISDIKDFFKSNTTPIYFISATNFNLLGMDEWVNNFKYISHIDSYEGKHPNLFSPKEEMPHDEFTSIEDINNYLLQHPEVINYIKSNAVNGDMGKALFLMFDEKTEQLAKAIGLDVCFPSAQLRTFLDNKVNTNRIAEKAGVACVPNVLSPVIDYKHFSHIGYHTGNGRSSSCQRAYKKSSGIRPLSAFKIPVTGADTILARGNLIFIHPKACRTPGLT